METNNKFKRKRIRIKEFDYKGAFIYFITICTFNKQEYFKDSGTINNLIYYLKQESAQFNYSIYAYCFMLNHLHLLLIGDEGSDLIKFIKMFKQKSGFYFKKRFGKLLWQRSFFDHVLRKRKHLNNIAGYIFENPMRKKLVDDFREYPYLGSFVFDLNDFYASYDQRGSIEMAV